MTKHQKATQLVKVLFAYRFFMVVGNQWHTLQNPDSKANYLGRALRSISDYAGLTGGGVDGLSPVGFTDIGVPTPYGNGASFLKWWNSSERRLFFRELVTMVDTRLEIGEVNRHLKASKQAFQVLRQSCKQYDRSKAVLDGILWEYDSATVRALKKRHS